MHVENMNEKLPAIKLIKLAFIKNLKWS